LVGKKLIVLKLLEDPETALDYSICGLEGPGGCFEPAQYDGDMDVQWVECSGPRYVAFGYYFVHFFVSIDVYVFVSCCVLVCWFIVGARCGIIRSVLACAAAHVNNPDGVFFILFLLFILLYIDFALYVENAVYSLLLLWC